MRGFRTGTLPLIPVAEQVVIAVSNLVLSLGVARQGGLRELGLLAVGTSVAWLIGSFQRAFLTEPLICSRGPVGARSSGTLFLVIQAFVVLAGIGAVASRQPDYLAGVIATLGVSGQEYQRAYHYNNGAVTRSLRANVVALGAFIALSLAPSIGVLASADRAMTVWGLIIWLAALTSMPGLRIARFGYAASWWLASCRKLASDLILDTVGITLASQLLLLLIAANHLEDGGRVRLLLMLYSPLTLLYSPLTLWFLSMLGETSSGLQNHYAVRKGLLLMAWASAYALGLTAVVSSLPPLVLGRTPLPATGLTMVAGLPVVLYCAVLPALAIAKLRNRMTPIALIRFGSGIVFCVTFVVLGATWGAFAYFILASLQAFPVAIITVWILASSRRAPIGEPDVPH